MFLKSKINSMLLIALPIALSACGGGGSSSNNANSTTPSSAASSGFSGQVQKGPLIFGSQITIYELDADLQQTGRSFDAQTTDDLGNFAVSAKLNTNLVSMVGVGYYMDELTGGLSSAPVTLNAIADLSVDANPTINILTTLATPRIKSLMQTGVAYRDAITQAQREVLAVFGIDADKVSGLQALYAMKINGTGDQDAALLATSAILSKMASNAALGGSSQAAQLSYYLSRIASDVKNYGRLNSATIRSALASASAQLDLAGVRNNVQTYYASRGVTLSAPKFEEWVDKNNSGILPQRHVPTTGLVFTDVTVETGVSTNSNAVTVSGLGSGITAQVSLTGSSSITSGSPGANQGSWRIVKNNSVLTGDYTTVQDGDVVGVQLTSGVFGNVTTTTMNVGSSSANWAVTTRRPEVAYANQGSNSPMCTGTSNYFAVPIRMPVTSRVNYVGIGVGASSAPDVISIYTDNNSEPGVPLISSSAISQGGYFAGSGYNKIDGTPFTANFFSYPQSQLSTTPSLVLQANTEYWVVMRYNSGGTPLCNFSSGSNPSANRSKKSADGTVWSDWSMYPQDLPGLFLAN